MALAAAGLLALLLGLCVGASGWDSALRWPTDALAQQIVWDIRLPRTLGAWLAGALLGLAGALAQGLFRNPLADPFLLGSASGASLFVTLALLVLTGWAGSGQGLDAGGGSGFALGLGNSAIAPGGAWFRLALAVGVTGAAFVGALVGVLLALALARGVQHTLRLLLAGVVVGVVLGAAKELLTVAVPSLLQATQAFMLGSTGFIGWSACAVMAVALVPALGVALALAKLLDALSLGESTAKSLGLPLPAARAALIAVLALATGAAVAQTGLIAFVGLAAPHMVRSLVRVRHSALLVQSALAGGLLLLLADLLARWLMAPQELPVGVLTALLGGGYLLWLMQRGGFQRVTL